MGTVRDILEGKDTTIHAIEPEATVRDAVAQMCRSHVGALLVNEHDSACGHRF
jgi:hypothetical protein